MFKLVILSYLAFNTLSTPDIVKEANRGINNPVIQDQVELQKQISLSATKINHLCKIESRENCLKLKKEFSRFIDRAIDSNSDRI